VQKLIQVGLNQPVDIELGNKSGWTYRGVRKQALKLTGIVKAISDGKIKVTGPIFNGSILNMGPSVLFETNEAQIVISSERVEPYDIAVMTSLGIELNLKPMCCSSPECIVALFFSLLAKALLSAILIKAALPAQTMIGLIFSTLGVRFIR
jgi:microcystin degradation protein MlrC